MVEGTSEDAGGVARMVDVSDKAVTVRRARARARLLMAPATLGRILEGSLPKGDVLGVATTAGIMAAKRTHLLIPLCHPLEITSVSVSFSPQGEDGSSEGDAVLNIEAEASVTARTGAEMEALVAVTVAGLTVYDMCKSVDRAMELTGVVLEEKSGGRSGDWSRS